MGDTYKIVEIVGTSSDSFEDAARNAVTEAGATVHDMCWFEMTGTRGYIEDGKIKEFQATVKIGFKVVRK